jgi:hypothetical protein
MPGLYEITFYPQSDVRTYCGSRGNYYLFEEGAVLELQTEFMWCACCQEFRNGENLEFHSPTRQQKLFLGNRVSAPRCLECGQTELSKLQFGEEIADPRRSSSGTIRIECVGLCSTEFNNWFFTPQGRRIRLDIKPGYWELKSKVWSRLSKEEDDPELANFNHLAALVMLVQDSQRKASLDEESLSDLNTQFTHPDVKELCAANLGLSATVYIGLHWNQIRQQITTLDGSLSE